MNDLSFSAKRGELIAIVGENDSGKNNDGLVFLLYQSLFCLRHDHFENVG